MKNVTFSKKIYETYNYIRFEHDSVPVYIEPDYPNWIAVNNAGDKILSRTWSSAGTTRPEPGNEQGDEPILWEIHKKKFLANLPGTSYEPYRGRAEYIALSHIEECWLHITDRCNLKCTHCLFSCSPKDKTTLSLGDIQKAVNETHKMGARIFYLTGGEPFIHKDIKEILNHILNNYEDTSLVVMTNGIRLPQYMDFLRTLPRKRLFFQLSADGTGENHDRTRGEGAFKKLLKGLASLKTLNTKNTISMVVHSGSISQMTDIIDLAAEYNINSVHFMWLIMTGRAKPEIFVEPETIFSHLVNACLHADEKGIDIDNIKNMESQVFSPAGTRYDLSNAGWRSLAIGPDKNIYPTAALIGEKELNCGNMDEGIETIWRTSPVLHHLRKTSIKESRTYGDSPFKFITGGGDIDHSYYKAGKFEGHDPYLPLYEKIILWIISQNAKKTAPSPYPRIQLKMGDRLLQCHSDGDGVSLTHSNCVLTFSNTKKVVGDFYTQADASGNEHIVNPVCYPETEISHIPGHSRIKSYGCGSPVLDADIQKNEVVVDLGSGAGVECFIAAKKTGQNGQVYGIDMLDHMLNKSNHALSYVSKNLGYNNVIFKKGFLEKIPLKDNEANLIISNCVINLSEDKRETLKEILRVLKPGGRIVISDVVTDRMSPPSIQNDEKLQGECIAGAMVQTHLFSILESIGFTDISIMKRFFYRTVKNHDFYSITYKAYKPRQKKEVDVIYPGPYAAVLTDNGDILVRGKKSRIQTPFHPENISPHILTLDLQGNADNIDAENSCCAYPASGSGTDAEADCDCFKPPQQTTQPHVDHAFSPVKLPSDCMVCGEPLEYLKNNEIQKCVYCSENFSTNARCKNTHFVCDACHGKDALAFAKSLLVRTKETDLIRLINILRAHPSFNLHGPEHHFAIPGTITAVYKNIGGNITEKDILTAIERGTSIPGGSCAFWGGCGAPLGAGIGFGVILNSTPLKPGKRQVVQKMVSEITAEIAKIKAARCCQRESWITLLKASALSEKYLDIKLPANGQIICNQMELNRECIKSGCRFYEK